MTWNEMKEKGKKFIKEHKEVCVFTAGVATGILLEGLSKSRKPADVRILFDCLNKDGIYYCINHVYKYGKEKEVTRFKVMARDILYYLAGEAK